MPVGTATTSIGSNHVAQLGLTASGSERASREIQEPTSLVGGGTAKGVTVENAAGRGDLNSAGEAAVITVSNSSDLNALAQAVALASFGENVLVEDSNFTQTGGISVDAGTIFERTVTLRNTTLAADIIKARSFQNGGRDALVIDGGRFDAARLVRLYATGDSKLRFRGDVEINSPVTQLAGQTVQVDAGGRVRVSGDVKVNAGVHNYDAAGFGTIEATGAKTRGTHESRSRF